MDPFAIYGDLYKNLREAVNDAMYDNQVDTLNEATKVLLLQILVASWHAVLYIFVYNLLRA